MGNEEEKFGLMVDCLGAVMKGLVLYVALLVINFWMYQDGVGDFQPWLLMTMIPYMVLVAIVYSTFDGVRCVGLHMTLGAIWVLWGLMVLTSRLYYTGAVLLGLGESLFQKFKLGDWDARRYARRYKMQNYIKWGVIITCFSILLIIYAGEPSKEYPIGVQACINYIILAFAVYLLSMVLFQYMFVQYNYFRQRDSMDQYSYGQLKRMNGIMAVVLILLIGLSVILLNKTIVQLLNKAVATLIGVIIGGGIMGLSNIKLKQTEGGSYVDVPTGAAPDVGNNVSSQFPVEEVGTILLIVAVGFLLFRIYKMFGAKYSTEHDEAEYIVPRDEEKRQYFTYKRKKGQENNFDNNNRGRIRKQYYRFMHARMKKSAVGKNRGDTPQELARKYGKPYEGEQLSYMTDIYEKARYSDLDCTDEDVLNMKELVNQTAES